MSRSSAERSADVITFRIPRALKDDLVEIARAEGKPVGEMLRDLVRRRVAEQERLVFEAEAQRQCLAANAAAANPNSDEAAVMRELEADLKEFSKEWK